MYVDNLLTTKLAGERLGISAQRVRKLITDQRLPAIKLGTEWLIYEADLVLVAERKPGRPPRSRVSQPAEQMTQEDRIDPNL